MITKLKVLGLQLCGLLVMLAALVPFAGTGMLAKLAWSATNNTSADLLYFFAFACLVIGLCVAYIGKHLIKEAKDIVGKNEIRNV